MNRAIILMYHIVDDPRTEREGRFCVRPSEFDRQMRWLRESGYLPVRLEQIVDCLVERKPMLSNAVAVTFDDGFSATAAHALPMLQAHGIPATMFVVTQRLGRANDWMYERGFPRRTLMSVAQLRELDAEGVTIGSHTATHPRLTEVSSAQAAAEIAQSKQQLEDTLGKPVRYFAYPYGLYSPELSNAVRASGYRAACSTRAGFNRDGENPFALRRIEVLCGDALWQFNQKLRFGTNHATRSYPLRYYASRIAARLGL